MLRIMAGNLPRLVGALITAPLASALIVSTPFSITWMIFRRQLDRQLFVVQSSVGALIAFASLVLIGLPFHLVAKPSFRVSWNTYVAAGFLIALLVTAFLVFWVALFLGTWVALGALFWGCAVGALTGYLFWLIRRPDRDAPPTQASPAP